MSEENIKRIGNYILNDRNSGGTMPVCGAAEAPTVVIMSEAAKALSSLPDRLGKMYISNAIKAVGDSAEEINEAVGEMISNAGIFTTPRILNVYIICGTGDAADRNTRIRELLEAYGTRFECINICSIYSFNELAEDKEEIKAHISALKAYEETETVIFLGAMHYDKRADSKDKLILAHGDIAASVIAFESKIKLGHGGFSFGMGYFSDYIEEYKVNILKKCYECRGADTGFAAAGETEKGIDKLVRETYTPDTACSFLGHILKNENVVGAASAKECVKLVYGDAAEIYIENEEKKYKNALEAVGESIEMLVKAENTNSLAEIAESISQKIETLKDRTENSAVYADSFTRSAEETLEVADRYVKAMAERLVNEYYIEIYGLCAKTIGAERENREKRKKMRAEELNDILLFINSVPLHGTGSAGSIPFTSGIDVSEAPIERICGAVNCLAEKEGTTAEDYFLANKDEEFFVMKRLAEPYCRNKEDGERYFFIGSTAKVDFAEMGAEELFSGGEPEDIRLLRCCRAVKLDYYI